MIQKKEPLNQKLARMGLFTALGAIFGYATGRLALAEGLAKLGRRNGMKVSLVSADDGLAAVDVDKEQDLFDVRRILADRAGD